MLYKYRAKKGPEDLIEGTIEAQNEKEAVDKLSLMGYLPVRISLLETKERKREDLVSLAGLNKPRRKIKSREITIFSRQLASLLKSGVPILPAINIIKEQSENIQLKYILTFISDAVKDGATFSSVLSQYPDIFSSLYIAIIRTGEEGGDLSYKSGKSRSFRTLF